MDAGGVVGLVAAVAAAAGGLLLLIRRAGVASGWLLLATAGAVPFMQAVQPNGSVLLTVTLLLDGAAPALAASAGVLWPVGRTIGVDAGAVAVALACVLLVGGLGPALVYDPVTDGCNACALNLLEVHADVALADSLSRISAASALLWGPLLVLIALRRVLAASRLARRQAWPLAVGAGIAALATIAAAHAAVSPADVVDDVQQQIWVLQAGLIVLLGAAAVLRVYLEGTAGRRMARIVVAAIPEQATVVESLRRAVADPGLDVHYVRADGTLIDADGAAVAPTGSGGLRLSRDRQVFAEVRSGESGAAPTPLVRSSVAAAGLALEYLSAQARLRAELRDAAAVRSRIVEAGSVERRRLERNLHDGAQQRLVALGLMLTATSATTGLSLDHEHAELAGALQELRTVARGLFPASLSERGVSAALRELGDHTRCPLVLVGAIDGAVPLAVGMAVYQLVSEVADAHSEDVPLRVELSGGGSGAAVVRLVTSMPDTTVRRLVVNAEDRFVAAGGHVRIHAGAAGAVVTAEAPCGS